MNREKWIINPGATTATHMEMFAFFGKLMGIAIRSKEYLALNIPSIIWKLLVRDTPTIEDLEAVDCSFMKSLDIMRNYDSPETFEDVFFETFTTTSRLQHIIMIRITLFTVNC